ncbi:MAG: Crp/Fnr family transcriptional regulator [Cyclobacteriaceae bacterium]
MQYDLLKNNFLRNADIPPEVLTSICDYYEEREVKKREFVLKKGQVCKFEGFVVEGCFKVFATDDEGAEKILYFAAEDWWVMDIDSFTNQTPSLLNIQAIENSRILRITKSNKELLYQKIPKVEHLFRIMSQKAVVAWQNRLIRNHIMDAEQRYHHFVTSYPEIARRVTNKQIASYLGITQEFVSKIRKRRLEKSI